MRSMSATDVPPNFITSRAMVYRGVPAYRRRNPAGAPAKKARIHTGGVQGLQPRRPIKPPRAEMAGKPQRQGASTTVDPAQVERLSPPAPEWGKPRGEMG